VAIIVPTLEQSIFADTVDGAESEFNVRNLQVLVGQTKYDIGREA
jgi:DNA-binding LacI/PurR family transcriptional regulator